MWRAGTPDPRQICLLRAVRERYDLYPLVIHVSYLVNLASLDPVIRTKSIAAFRGELERAHALGAEFLVLHPGSYRDSTTDEGIAAFVLGLRDAAEGLPEHHVTVLLENTAGAGCHLGSRFEELRSLRDLAGELTGLRVDYCLDTCHLLSAGYNIASITGWRETMRQAEAILGLANVRVIHANDSKFPLGSHVDRHANIGEGYIGEDAFRRILTIPRCATNRSFWKPRSMWRATTGAISKNSKRSPRLAPGVRAQRGEREKAERAAEPVFQAAGVS